MAKITINLKEDELAFKRMIEALSESETLSNPYYNRSESEIAKMIIKKPLEEMYKKYTQDKRN